MAKEVPTRWTLLSKRYTKERELDKVLLPSTQTMDGSDLDPSEQNHGVAWPPNPKATLVASKTSRTNVTTPYSKLGILFLGIVSFDLCESVNVSMVVRL
jgi:hypothetical protein